LLSLPPTPFLWLHILGFINRYCSDMLAHGSIGITFSQGRAIPCKWPCEYTHSQLMPLSPYPLIRLILNPLLRKRVNNRYSARNSRHLSLTTATANESAISVSRPVQWKSDHGNKTEWTSSEFGRSYPF